MLESLGFDKIIPSFYINENKIVYKKEKKLPVAAKFDVNLFDKIFKDILLCLYKNKNEFYSSGLYSYLNFQYPLKLFNKTGKGYFEHLMEEYLAIVHRYNILNNKERILLQYYELVQERLILYKETNIEKFHLLHGDFHIGNILYSQDDKKYKMIDFEYVRYGMPELEIANFIVQLLDGGNYVYPYFNQYIKIIYDFVKKNTCFDCKIIHDVFLPLLLFFRLWRCINEVNIKQKLVKDGVIYVAEKYLIGDYDEYFVNNSAVQIRI